MPSYWQTAVVSLTLAVVPLVAEIAEDAAFERVVATAQARALTDVDHTRRVSVGGLAPARPAQALSL